MKILVRLMFICLIVIMTATIITPVFAADQFIKIVQDVDTASQNPTDATAEASMIKIGGDILAFIRNLSIILGMVLLSILGVKYMLGSADEKASYKKSLVPLTVGFVIVIAATTIVSVVYNIATVNLVQNL